MRGKLASYEGKKVEGWIGVVVSVSTSLGQTWVSIKQDNVEFKLWPEGNILGNKPLDIFSSLNKGDRVIFDGVLGSEMSITISGAIDEPELRVNPTRVEKL